MGEQENKFRKMALSNGYLCSCPVISMAISIHFHMIKYIFDHCGLLTFQNGLLLFHDGGHFSFTIYIYSCLGKVY
jgi:hypothetical protein